MVNMTNLQSLSIFLTERLMLAAQEILKAVEVTVTEYHDEILRSRQENELLKNRLVEAGIPLYPDLQPGLSVFHEDPCTGSEREEPDEKVQVKQEPSASREEPQVSPPQTSIHEEPISPSACLEDQERLEEMLHSHIADNSPSPLLNSHQCMQIKEENQELKSVARAEIFCASQSCASDDPSSALASNNAAELETELDRLSAMHNAPEISTPAKLRIVLDENDIRKLVLPAGIPRTLQDLTRVIKETFDIPDYFTLMYRDMHFGVQFFTVSSIDDVRDRCTLKVVQTEPITLNLIAVKEEPVLQKESDATSFSSQDTVVPCPSLDFRSESSQDTILPTSSESFTSCRSQGWPAKFKIPTFSFDTEILLSEGNKVYQKDGTLLNNPRVMSSILQTLAETMFRYTAYPTGVQIINVVDMLIKKYPCLKEPGPFNRQYGWQQRIKYKMGNYRARLRGSQISCPELKVNSWKTNKTNEQFCPRGMKRPRKAEVNYLPPFPFGETEESLELKRVNLLKEIQKKNNRKVIGEIMEKTFSYRRSEIIKHCFAVKQFMERWPALFCESEIKNEFRRITTIPLEQTFLQKLDLYTPKLLDLFKTKGGEAGTKIRSVLDSLSQQVEAKRDAVIRCLFHYLGESSVELIKNYQGVSRDLIKDSFTNHVMKIIVLGSTTEEENANMADIIIVIEGTEVLLGCKNLTNACLLLMGLIYSLNMSYPPKLRNTFEVFQKIFLGLDTLKFSPKVSSLHRKLLIQVC